MSLFLYIYFCCPLSSPTYTCLRGAPSLDAAQLLHPFPCPFFLQPQNEAIVVSLALPCLTLYPCVRASPPPFFFQPFPLLVKSDRRVASGASAKKAQQAGVGWLVANRCDGKPRLVHHWFPSARVAQPPSSRPAVGRTTNWVMAVTARPCCRDGDGRRQVPSGPSVAMRRPRRRPARRPVLFGLVGPVPARPGPLVAHPQHDRHSAVEPHSSLHRWTLMPSSQAPSALFRPSKSANTVSALLCYAVYIPIHTPFP